MSVDLFERYREALRRGHAASARGDLDAALIAYREAAGLAPDRAAPLLGVGGILLRQGDAAEAHSAFAAAAVVAPRDEIALRGRAEALATLGRRTEAADALDVLSEMQEADGRLVEAVATGDRALALAEGKLRRRRLVELRRHLRLETARVTESPQATPVEVAPAGAGRAAAAVAVEPEPAAAEEGTLAPAAEPEAVEPEVPAHLAASGPEEAEPPEPVEPAPPPEPLPDPVGLALAADRALDAGDRSTARRDYLAAAAAFGSQGLLAAALDACYGALAFAPDDAELHLQLVRLYLELGWNPAAADKLALLARLVDLDGGPAEVRAEIVGLAADRFPDDPRLRGLVSAGLPRDA